MLNPPKIHLSQMYAWSAHAVICLCREALYIHIQTHLMTARCDCHPVLGIPTVALGGSASIQNAGLYFNRLVGVVVYLCECVIG